MLRLDTPSVFSRSILTIYGEAESHPDNSTSDTYRLELRRAHHQSSYLSQTADRAGMDASVSTVSVTRWRCCGHSTGGAGRGPRGLTPRRFTSSFQRYCGVTHTGRTRHHLVRTPQRRHRVGLRHGCVRLTRPDRSARHCRLACGAVGDEAAAVLGSPQPGLRAGCHGTVSRTARSVATSRRSSLGRRQATKISVKGPSRPPTAPPPAAQERVYSAVYRRR